MRLVFAALLLMLLPLPATAGCHLVDCVEEVPVSKEDLQPLSCETLWVLRNSIFKEYGYCFKTKRAIDWFGNDNCGYGDVASVPLSPVQAKNVEKIKAMETWQGCQ